jgi:hypothetical protein
MPRTGAIQAAINMDFPGTREYESLAIYFGQYIDVSSSLTYLYMLI